MNSVTRSTLTLSSIASDFENQGPRPGQSPARPPRNQMRCPLGMFHRKSLVRSCHLLSGKAPVTYGP